MGWPEVIVEAVGLRKRLLDTAARVNRSVDSAAPPLSRYRGWCINIPQLLEEAVGGLVGLGHRWVRLY